MSTWSAVSVLLEGGSWPVCESTGGSDHFDVAYTVRLHDGPFFLIPTRPRHLQDLVISQHWSAISVLLEGVYHCVRALADQTILMWRIQFVFMMVPFSWFPLNPEVSRISSFLSIAGRRELTIVGKHRQIRPFWCSVYMQSLFPESYWTPVSPGSHHFWVLKKIKTFFHTMFLWSHTGAPQESHCVSWYTDGVVHCQNWAQNGCILFFTSSYLVTIYHDGSD